MVSPQAKRVAVKVLMTERSLGVTRACGLLSISRSLYRYRSRRPDSAPLRARIEEIAAVKRRYGYRRVYLRLRREGWEVNRKRVYRLYHDAGLAVRRRKRKRIGSFERKPLPKPTAANLSWSMDFVADGLIDGRRLRCLTIVDDCTRECLTIEVDTSITGLRVQGVLDRLADTRGLSKSITVDTVQNSTARCSINGRIGTPSSCRSYGRASRMRTRTSKVSTGSSATSV
jgi:putative transposase